jgi:catechol 2,3-dioxygenase-like lactoylglutathione lyase family enzyme
MELGAFSISLAVDDLETSRDFYRKLGFEPTGGDGEQYLMMRNHEGTLIGLFQGLFEENILTFNPGFRQDMSQPNDFLDVREIRDRLLEAGLELTTDLDPESTGPAAIALLDPDGNTVLIDQHVPRPGEG